MIFKFLMHFHFVLTEVPVIIRAVRHFFRLKLYQGDFSALPVLTVHSLILNIHWSLHFYMLLGEGATLN